MQRILAYAAITLMVTGCASEIPQAKPEEVSCQGQIESFAKDGFQGLTLDSGCEYFDITWVVVQSPEEFAGVRHMLLSRTADGKSAFGIVGEKISFSAFRSTLESEKHPERGRVDMKKLLEDVEGQKQK